MPAGDPGTCLKRGRRHFGLEWDGMKRSVLLTAPRLNTGGAETMVSTLAHGLRQSGWEVSLASGGGRTARALAREGFRHYFVPFRWHTGLAHRLLMRAIRHCDPALLHAHAANAGVVTASVCRQTALPWILTAHGRLFRTQKKYRCFDEAQRILCVSDFLRQDILKQADYPAHLLHVVTNGVDTNRLHPMPDRARLRRQFGLDPDAFTLVIAARLFSPYRKGHDLLFRLLREYPDASRWQLIVIGDGPYGNRLRRSARDLVRQRRVLFLGRIDAIKEPINAAHVAVLPTFSETFGLFVAEAMACGLPCVASRVGGLPEVIEDGVTGFLVERRELGPLHDRLLWLSEHPDDAIRMGQAGLERVNRLFTAEQMTRAVEQHYIGVLSEVRG